MINFALTEGSPGLDLKDVAHILLPGRGRNENGNGLSRSGERRALWAAEFFVEQDLASKGGVIVASGYKTPADKAGDLWSPEDSDEVFTGVPEAYAYRDFLLKCRIGDTAIRIQPCSIRVEPHSIDTVTNLVRSEKEGHFPDNRPVAVVAQRNHLARTLEIADKVLDRPFMGIVVPEQGIGEPDSTWAQLASRAVLLGIHPNTARIVRRTTSRAERIWSAVNGAQAAKRYATSLFSAARDTHKV